MLWFCFWCVFSQKMPSSTLGIKFFWMGWCCLNVRFGLPATKWISWLGHWLVLKVNMNQFVGVSVKITMFPATVFSFKFRLQCFVEWYAHLSWHFCLAWFPFFPRNQSFSSTVKSGFLWNLAASKTGLSDRSIGFLKGCFSQCWPLKHNLETPKI